jgi:hypothetical protein
MSLPIKEIADADGRMLLKWTFNNMPVRYGNETRALLEAASSTAHIAALASRQSHPSVGMQLS